MTKPLTVALPDDILDDAAKAASAAGETLESFVARAVSLEVERERTEEFFAERRARANVSRALEILNRDGGQKPETSDALPEGYTRS